MSARFAQDGQRERCLRCGRVVELRLVGHRHDGGAAVFRWCAVARTPKAPRPIDCPARDDGKGYHRPAGFGYGGQPISTEEEW
jgi:hypothetical protein